MNIHLIWRTILLVVTLLVSAFNCQASGPLKDIRIENGVLYFSAENIATTASCVDAQNQDIWAVSMDSDKGRAVYVALMMATSAGANVNVVSAGDCLDATGFERAKSLSIASQ